MNGFNPLLLLLAGLAVLLFVLFAVLLQRRMRAQERKRPPARPSRSPKTSLAIEPVVAIVEEKPPYAPWRLIERSLANPGSAGGPLYRLRLEPEGSLPRWRAGAVARVYCGPSEEVLDASRTASSLAGDYMIGSLPGDGAVELVVRRVPDTGPNGGHRSRWLCEEVRLGERVAMVLRDDPAFMAPPDEVPLILIGNATGIAGLHAHVRARPAGTRNWLIFGDRNSADDAALAAEISQWVATGHLERCDLVLPGDGNERRLVTDQIADAKAPILDWALAGGAIYVCGSDLMGNDVHAALTDVLGQGVLEAMAEAGLYRCAVY